MDLIIFRKNKLFLDYPPEKYDYKISKGQWPESMTKHQAHQEPGELYQDGATYLDHARPRMENLTCTRINY